jgi:hypothetical protein
MTGPARRWAHRGWPHSLKTVISLMLNSAAADVDGLGRAGDVFIQRRLHQCPQHGQASWALGRPTIEVWAEIWDYCGPLVGACSRMAKSPRPMACACSCAAATSEECFFAFSYSPVRDESGNVAGLFAPTSMSPAVT